MTAKTFHSSTHHLFCQLFTENRGSALLQKNDFLQISVGTRLQLVWLILLVHFPPWIIEPQSIILLHVGHYFLKPFQEE